MDNVYTQHQPLLYDTIDNINKGRVHADRGAPSFFRTDMVAAGRETTRTTRMQDPRSLPKSDRRRAMLVAQITLAVV